jgi:hypothetical protein
MTTETDGAPLAHAVESMTRLVMRFAEQNTQLVHALHEQGQTDLQSRTQLAGALIERRDQEARIAEKEDAEGPISEETQRKLVAFLTSGTMGATARDVMRVLIRRATEKLDELDALDAAKAATPAAAPAP